MQQTRSYDGWRKGAQEAADCLASGAAGMLAVIVRSPFAKWRADRTMLEDLTVITVDRAYGDGKRLQIQIRGPDDPRQYLLAEIEDLTVKKIQVLAEESANFEVVGLNIKAVGLKERI